MWKLIDKPKTQKVTKSLAKQFAEMDPAPNDRQLSERRLQVYQRLLAEGQFRPVTWATAICQETGGLYRVNGKHTSVMLSGMEKLPDFFVTVEEYECDTLEDVAKLYATFDSGMQSRSARDIYLSFAGTLPELKDVSTTIITQCVSGLAYAKFGENHSKTQPADRAELLLDHVDFALWLSELIAGAQSKTHTGARSQQKALHILRRAAIAAMFATYSKAKGPSTEFWSSVRDETGATPSTPDRKLAKFLLLAGVKTSRQYVRKSTDREIYAKCLHAWNAWRKGEVTNLNYYADAKVPVAH